MLKQPNLEFIYVITPKLNGPISCDVTFTHLVGIEPSYYPSLSYEFG